MIEFIDAPLLAFSIRRVSVRFEPFDIRTCVILFRQGSPYTGVIFRLASFLLHRNSTCLPFLFLG